MDSYTPTAPADELEIPGYDVIVTSWSRVAGVLAGRQEAEVCGE